MELVAKAADAALMFWQSLDTHERAVLAYGAAWLVFAAIAAAHRRDRERIKYEVLEELVAGGNVRA